jgi:glutathione S-transferase
MTLTLHYAPDNASLIVRLALEEAGLPYRTVLVDRAKRAQDGPAYRALNPAGLIPVLETPRGPIFETGAILLWLSEQAPGLAPAPGDARRGSFLTWLLFTSNTLHTGLRMTFYSEKYAGPDAQAQAALRATVQTRLTGDLGLIDAAYGADAPFFIGDTPCLLDLYLAPLLRWCALYPDGQTGGFDLARYTRLARMAHALEQRPATHAAQRAEGLGPAPFTAPVHANPPEGSAT